MGTTLRYDGIPLQDFLACLMQYEADPRRGFLPSPAALKDVKMTGSLRWQGSEEPVPLSLYLMQERDALTQKTETFLLLHAPSRWAEALTEVAFKLREFLQRRQIHTLFRVDPRYGLVCGSAREPVDPSVKWDRPGAYIALYLTDDVSSPSLALLDYVPMDCRGRFQKIFMKYNAVAPVAASALTTTWKRWLGREPHADTGSPHVKYRMIKGLAQFLQGENVSAPSISLIYKDVSQSELGTSLLDPSLATHYAAGQDRFFASLGELA